MKLDKNARRSTNVVDKRKETYVPTIENKIKALGPRPVTQLKRHAVKKVKKKASLEEKRLNVRVVERLSPQLRMTKKLQLGE